MTTTHLQAAIRLREEEIVKLKLEIVRVENKENEKK